MPFGATRSDSKPSSHPYNGLINDEAFKSKLLHLLNVRKSKRALTPPATQAPTDYPWMVGSNEPTLPIAPLFDHGQFTVIGCGCLKPIEAAFAVINFDKYQPHDDQYTNVPKLFIIDNSLKLQKAWLILKQAVCQSSTLKEFYGCLNEKVNFKALSNFHNQEGFTRFANTLSNFVHTQADFQLFKNMVQKATFVLNDWLEPDAMQFALNHSTQPKIIYASNIAEILVNDIENPLQKVDEFIQSVTHCEPVLSFYSRTSLESLARSIKTNRAGTFAPDAIDTIEGSQFNQHKPILFQKDSLLNFAKLSISTPEKDLAAVQKKLLGLLP